MTVKIIDLFAGAGGFAHAAMHAGADLSLSVELDAHCCETLRAMRTESNHNVAQVDISALDGGELRAMAKVQRKDRLVVVGGPPCQPFSKASYWTDPGKDAEFRRKRAAGLDAAKPAPIRKPKADPRRSLLNQFAELVVDSDADGFVLENVRSLLHPRNKPQFEVVLRHLDEAGFNCAVVKANAASFGVPQKRERVFVLGSKASTPIPPVPQYRVSPKDDPSLPEAMSAGQAIKPFKSSRYKEAGEEVSGRYASELKEIPPGWNYKFLTEWAGHPKPAFVAERRFWNFLLKLDPDKPSWTINANPGPWVGPFHWTSRRLRTVELAALQSFPSDHKFVGNRRQVVRQIGNAVPPLLAEPMISSVMSTL